MIDKKLSEKFASIGICIPDILLPAKNIELDKWAVVACDQYTSEPAYWKNVADFVGESPSTLHMILPEIYLEEDNSSEREKNIYKSMERYINEQLLVSQSPGFVYVERKTKGNFIRKGLVVAVDLEKYDFNKGSTSLIRATEGTVIDRLPPRVKIREKASLEIPHILLLIDDPEKTVIEPLAEKLHDFEKLYDFDLMLGGNNIKGYKVEKEEILLNIADAFQKLILSENNSSRNTSQSPLLFAVGDGNHSLAAAKVHWENVKKCLDAAQAKYHPARYALVELVNVHDESIIFEPIYRIVFNVNAHELLNNMVLFFGGNENCIIIAEEQDNSTFEGHKIPFVSKDISGTICIKNPKSNLEVGSLQAFLDYCIKINKDIKIDYIHGEDVVKELGVKEGNMGFFLPAMNKHDLFKTVILDGALPRKTFSMGSAEEKRFYMECRKIV